jgi:transcriptional regulator of acetoin/glycerol metabolism
MQVIETEPFDPAEQRNVERHWLATMRDHRAAVEVRSVVRESWERCLVAGVEPRLPSAPMVLDESSLATTRECTDWVALAERVVRQQDGSFGGPGHVITLFDAAGRMLASEGDPAARDGLAGINFAPGGLWTEDVVGTNGPGTALAEGRPVHVVGAEHFCQAWHRWHCAAVPVRDPVTGLVLGVLDISGFREYAHPHSLNLAQALAFAIEQMLSAREAERRFLTLSRLTDLAARYPADASFAVDRAGRILLSSPELEGVLPTEAARRLDRTLAALLAESRDSAPREVTLPPEDYPARKAVWYPVLDGRTVVGGCLLVERPRPPAAPHRPPGASGARYTFGDVVGVSPSLRQALALARTAAATELPVLLLGETGTGKEVFAQAIHHASARRARPFVAVNCAALPRELIESELFGYVGGAFSGARREGASGKFEAADGGTIFLDEIGELSSGAQAALLRVLQEGEITKVGSARSRQVDVRVIAATNRDVEAAVASGRLRADVFHRLNVMPIELAALRERPADIRPLTAHFLREAARELGRPGAALDPAVVASFERHSWPGNVRELKNLVRRLVACAAAFPIRAEELADAGLRSERARPDEQESAARLSTAAERELMDVVARSRTMAEAASRLGVTRSTLYRRMERLGLRPERVLRPH